MKKIILILTGILFCTEIVYSQSFYNYGRNRNLILSVGTGTTHYYGDLAKNGDHTNIRPNFAIGARYNFYKWFSAGTEFTWFMLAGHDKTDPVKVTRNLSFESHNFELSAVIHASLFQESSRFYVRRFANPYLYAGIGLVSYNPTAKLPDDDNRYNLRKLNTSGEDYSGITASFPVGIGVKLRIDPFFNVVIDGGYRFLLSDHIDDVSSGVYPDPTSFSNEKARLLSDRTWETLPDGEPTWAEQGKNFRGNPNDKDGYFIFNIKLEYYFSEIGGQKIGGPNRGPRQRRLKAPKQRKYKAPKQRKLRAPRSKINGVR